MHIREAIFAWISMILFMRVSLCCPSSARDQTRTPWEVSGLRGFRGSLQWLATQEVPWTQAELSILQGEEHTVGTMRKLTTLLRQAQQPCSRRLVFHCHRALCVVTYPDAAARAVRRKGESKAGYLTCLADAEHLTGQEGPLSLVSWDSGRCRRNPHSSLSAEG